MDDLGGTPILGNLHRLKVSTVYYAQLWKKQLSTPMQLEKTPVTYIDYFMNITMFIVF